MARTPKRTRRSETDPISTGVNVAIAASTQENPRVISPRTTNSAVVASTEENPQVVMISPPTNMFNAVTWWMVDLQFQGNNVPREGATVLVKRCLRKYPEWDEAFARRVLKAYQQFLILKKEKQDWDATLLPPCDKVDLVWHEHMLDVCNYYHDCMLLCGHIVGHNPDGALNAEAKATRDRATRETLFERFGNQYDAELWWNQAWWNQAEPNNEVTFGIINQAEPSNEMPLLIGNQAEGGYRIFYKTCC
jgi:hypothetical protein